MHRFEKNYCGEAIKRKTFFERSKTDKKSCVLITSFWV